MGTPRKTARHSVQAPPVAYRASQGRGQAAFRPGRQGDLGQGAELLGLGQVVPGVARVLALALRRLSPLLGQARLVRQQAADGLGPAWAERGRKESLWAGGRGSCGCGRSGLVRPGKGLWSQPAGALGSKHAALVEQPGSPSSLMASVAWCWAPVDAGLQELVAGAVYAILCVDAGAGRGRALAHYGPTPTKLCGLQAVHVLALMDATYPGAENAANGLSIQWEAWEN